MALDVAYNSRLQAGKRKLTGVDMSFFRNRITMALLGLIIFGTVGILATTRPKVPQTSAVSQSATQPTQATPTVSSDATTPTPTTTSPVATMTPTDTTPIAKLTLTATSSASATATSAPTKTPAPATTLRGTIGTVTTSGGQSFTFALDSGGTITIVADSNTHYQGINSFNSLRSGQTATVTEHASTGGTLLATNIQVQQND